MNISINHLQVNITTNHIERYNNFLKVRIPLIVNNYFESHFEDTPDLELPGIKLDLGAFSQDSFEREFEVRLSYLLDRELYKLVNSGDTKFYLQGDTKSKLKSLQHYLEKGFNVDDHLSMSALFKDMLVNDITRLSQLITSISASPNAIRRLYYQVDFELWQTFWDKTDKSTYQEVKGVNEHISSQLGSGHLRQKMTPILKERTFDFLTGHGQRSSTSLEYINYLFENIETFQPLFIQDGKTTSQLFSELSSSFSKEVSHKKGVLRPLTTILNKIRLDQSITFVTTSAFEKLFSQLTVAEIEQLTINLIQIFGESSLLSVTVKFSPTSWHRPVLAHLMIYGTSSLRRLMMEVIYLEDLLQQVAFLVKLNVSSELKLKYLLTIPEKDRLRITHTILESAAIKLKVDLKNLTQKLRKYTAQASHPQGILLRCYLNQMTQLEASPIPSCSSANLFDYVIIYLESGVWSASEASPQKGLQQILDDFPQKLKARMLKVGVIGWLRIIYQHPIITIGKLMATVFADDPNYLIFQERLAELRPNRSHLRDWYYSFIEALERLKSRDEERSFPVLFDQLVSEVTTESLSMKRSVSAPAKPDSYLVRAVIHYLKFGTFIDPDLEKMGIEETLFQVIDINGDVLADQLKQNDTEYLLKELLRVLPRDRWAILANSFLPDYEGHFIDDLEELHDSTTLSVVKIVAYLMLAVDNRQKLRNIDGLVILLNQARESQEATISLPKPARAFQKITLESSGIAEPDQELKIAENFVNLGIRKRYQRNKNAFDLISEVLRTDRFPEWASITSFGAFNRLLLHLSKYHPRAINRLIRQHIALSSKPITLFRLLGLQKVKKLIAATDPKTAKGASELVKMLVELHVSFGKRPALENYFYQQFLFSTYTYYERVGPKLAIIIMKRFAIDFAIPEATYRHFLKSNKSSLAQTYLRRKPPKNSLDSPSTVTYELELLTYLFTYGEPPWWGLKKDQREHYNMVYVQNLVDKLISHHADSLVNFFQLRVNADFLFRRLIAVSKSTGFKKLLETVNPDWANLIDGMNMLLMRSGISKLHEDWLLFEWNSLRNFRSLDDVFAFIGWTAPRKAAKMFSQKHGQFLRTLTTQAESLAASGQQRYKLIAKALETHAKRVPGRIPSKANRSLPGEKNLSQTLIDYMKFGAISSDAVHFGNYRSFAQALLEQSWLGDSELRIHMASLLGVDKIRSRIIEEESVAFHWLLLDLYFPLKKNLLRAYLQDVKQLIKKLSSGSDYELVESAFFNSALQLTIDNPMLQINPESFARDLIQKIQATTNINLRLNESDTQSFKPNTDLGLHLIELMKSTGDSFTTFTRLPPPVRTSTEPERLTEDHNIYISNAGIVLAAPFFERYFSMLGMVEENKFLSEDQALRGIFLLQYIVTGKASAPEHELVLNKILCGLDLATPVPSGIDLTESETEMTESLLYGFLQNWGRKENTSVEALRETFLNRNGLLFEREANWALTVERKTVDILLNSLPWAISTLKLPWMNKPLNVKWLTK